MDKGKQYTPEEYIALLEKWLQELTDEHKALEARWENVPWERLLHTARRLIGELVHQGLMSSELEKDYRWLKANAPPTAP